MMGLNSWLVLTDCRSHASQDQRLQVAVGIQHRGAWNQSENTVQKHVWPGQARHAGRQRHAKQGWPLNPLHVKECRTPPNRFDNPLCTLL